MSITLTDIPVAVTDYLREHVDVLAACGMVLPFGLQQVVVRAEGERPIDLLVLKLEAASRREVEDRK